MSASGDGYYMLTLWADAAGVSGVTVRTNFKVRYGEAMIEEIGRAAPGLFYGEVKSAMQDLIDDGASKENPTELNIKNAMLKASGYTPGLFSTVLKEAPKAITSAVENVGSYSKWIVVGVVAVAVIYALANVKNITGAFKGAP